MGRHGGYGGRARHGGYGRRRGYGGGYHNRHNHHRTHFRTHIHTRHRMGFHARRRHHWNTRRNWRTRYYGTYWRSHYYYRRHRYNAGYISSVPYYETPAFVQKGISKPIIKQHTITVTIVLQQTAGLPAAQAATPPPNAFVVTCPAWHTTGPIQVTSPFSGQMLTVNIPAGITPGMDFTIQEPAAPVAPAAPAASDAGKQVMLDTNNDGVGDTVAIAIDSNGDGIVDMYGIDVDGDGTLDKYIACQLDNGKQINIQPQTLGPNRLQLTVPNVPELKLKHVIDAVESWGETQLADTDTTYDVEDVDYRVQHVTINGIEWTDGRYGPPTATETYQVTLPATCRAGGLVTIQLAGGKTQTIKVPANSGPGQVITVARPPAELPELTEEQEWAFPTASPPHANFIALLHAACVPGQLPQVTMQVETQSTSAINSGVRAGGDSDDKCCAKCCIIGTMVGGTCCTIICMIMIIIIYYSTQP